MEYVKNNLKRLSEDANYYQNRCRHVMPIMCVYMWIY